MNIFKEKIYLLEEEFYDKIEKNQKLIPHTLIFDIVKDNKKILILFLNDNNKSISYFIRTVNNNIKTLDKIKQISNDTKKFKQAITLNNLTEIINLNSSDVDFFKEIKSSCKRDLNRLKRTETKPEKEPLIVEDYFNDGSIEPDFSFDDDIIEETDNFNNEKEHETYNFREQVIKQLVEQEGRKNEINITKKKSIENYNLDTDRQKLFKNMTIEDLNNFDDEIPDIDF